MIHAAISVAQITPSPGVYLQGHWSETASLGVLAPLEIRALVVKSDQRTVCIISIDAIGIAAQTTDQIRQGIQYETGIPCDHVLILCSHTHCAPAMLNCLGMCANTDFLRAVVEKSVAAASTAVSQVCPVRIGLGCGSAFFNVNRRPLPGSTDMTANFGGVVDHRVRVLRIDRTSGEPLAVVFHFSCHPTTKAGSDGLISPDYPGITRQLIEKHLECRALFLQGCCGNIRPLIVNQEGRFVSASPQKLSEISATLARTVLATALAIRTADAVGVSACTERISIPYGRTKDLGELQRLAANVSTPFDREVIATWAAGVTKQLQQGDLPASENSEMQAIRIGPLAIIAIPGEPVQEIGHAIERTLAQSTDVEAVWPVGYANDMLGYLCTEQHYTEGGYEPTAYSFYNRPAPFRQEQEIIVTAAETLLRNLR